MNVLTFAGSTRAQSWNKKLLALANAELSRQGATVDTFDFTSRTAPVFDDDLVASGAVPPEVLSLKARIRQADAVLIATPEYNYSFPGPLKNLLDWMSRPPKDNPFVGKGVGQIGATTGSGGTLQAQNALRHLLGVALLATVLPGPAFTVSKVDQALDERGELKEEALRKGLSTYLGRLLGAIPKR